MELKGKKVLFIGPSFFGYEVEIKKELESLGADVTFFAEKPYSISYRVSKHISSKFQKKIEEDYLNSILSSIDNFDIFFLIRGEIITEDFLKSLKQKNPNAIFIMYQWDSVKNNPNYVNILKYFDKVSTFDMVNAKTLNINYLPLFYIKKYENLEQEQEKKYDIVFFGSYHGDRLEVVKKISEECERLGLVFKHHLFIPKLALLKRLCFFKLKFSDLKYLSTKSVSIDEILESYKVTKAVLDIENPGQNGLTMRTFEVLGAGLKLITTNKHIKNEFFFNSNNIFVLDRDKLKFDNKFIHQAIHKTQFNYLLTDWIKVVFYDL
jgi:hypothetical protein